MNAERAQVLRPTAALVDALRGMEWWNGLTRAERSRWLQIADSATPADAWQAFKASRKGVRP